MDDSMNSGDPASGLGLRAILWDFDGTLINTEPIWALTEIDQVQRHGGQWSMQDCQANIGSNMPRLAEVTLAAVPQPAPGEPALPSVEQWLDELLTTLAGRLESRPLALEPDVGHLLDQAADQGLGQAIVTASPTRVLDAIRHHLGSMFDVFVDGDHVPAQKPDPAPYRLAAEQLGVDVADCIAIEDSTNGRDSAVAAGVACIVRPSLAKVEPAPGALIVESLADLTLADLDRLRAELGDQLAHRR